MNPGTYAGGAATMRKAGVAAAVGLVLTALLAALGPSRALWAYHVAFVYWSGIALASLLLLFIVLAMKARWPIVVRRVLEVMSGTSALFVVLFVPVALFARKLFPWAEPERLQGEMRHLAEHRAPWLNVPFVVARGFLVLAAFAVLAWLVHGASVRQDREKGFALTEWQRKVGTGALPFIALAFTIAAFDWQMSLDLRFTSTIFGVYWFGGSFLAAISVLVLAVHALDRGGPLTGLVNASHYHSLGKLQLAFVVFWAYIAISQYLLVWIANIPEEVPWYIVRGAAGWRALGFFLLVFHFVLPFLVLLSRDLKRNPRALSIVSVYLLVVHWVDIYWVVMPVFQPEGPRPSLADLTATVGVGAAALAFALWRLRGSAAVPVGDPYLEDSLRYDPS